MPNFKDILKKKTPTDVLLAEYGITESPDYFTKGVTQSPNMDAYRLAARMRYESTQDALAPLEKGVEQGSVSPPPGGVVEEDGVLVVKDTDEKLSDYYKRRLAEQKVSKALKKYVDPKTGEIADEAYEQLGFNGYALQHSGLFSAPADITASLLAGKPVDAVSAMFSGGIAQDINLSLLNFNEDGSVSYAGTKLNLDRKAMEVLGKAVQGTTEYDGNLLQKTVGMVSGLMIDMPLLIGSGGLSSAMVDKAVPGLLDASVSLMSKEGLVAAGAKMGNSMLQMELFGVPNMANRVVTAHTFQDAITNLGDDLWHNGKMGLMFGVGGIIGDKIGVGVSSFLQRPGFASTNMAKDFLRRNPQVASHLTGTGASFATGYLSGGDTTEDKLVTGLSFAALHFTHPNAFKNFLRDKYRDVMVTNDNFEKVKAFMQQGFNTEEAMKKANDILPQKYLIKEGSQLHEIDETKLTNDGIVEKIGSEPIDYTDANAKNYNYITGVQPFYFKALRHALRDGKIKQINKDVAKVVGNVPNPYDFKKEPKKYEAYETKKAIASYTISSAFEMKKYSDVFKKYNLPKEVAKVVKENAKVDGVFSEDLVAYAHANLVDYIRDPKNYENIPFKEVKTIMERSSQALFDYSRNESMNESLRMTPEEIKKERDDLLNSNVKEGFELIRKEKPTSLEELSNINEETKKKFAIRSLANKLNNAKGIGDIIEVSKEASKLGLSQKEIFPEMQRIKEENKKVLDKYQTEKKIEGMKSKQEPTVETVKREAKPGELVDEKGNPILSAELEKAGLLPKEKQMLKDKGEFPTVKIKQSEPIIFTGKETPEEYSKKIEVVTENVKERLKYTDEKTSREEIEQETKKLEETFDKDFFNPEMMGTEQSAKLVKKDAERSYKKLLDEFMGGKEPDNLDDYAALLKVANNRDDRATVNKILSRMRVHLAKQWSANLGVNPKLAYDMLRLGYHEVKQGAKDFADWSKRMGERLGESWNKFKDFWKEFYDTVKAWTKTESNVGSDVFGAIVGMDKKNTSILVGKLGGERMKTVLKEMEKMYETLGEKSKKMYADFKDAVERGYYTMPDELGNEGKYLDLVDNFGGVRTESDDSDDIMFKTDDNKTVVFNKDNYKHTVSLYDIMDDKKIFQIYPELSDIKVGYDPASIAGAYYTSSGKIMLTRYTDRTSKDVESAILHEIQHAVDHIEGTSTLESPASISFVLNNNFTNPKYARDIVDTIDKLTKEGTSDPYILNEMRAKEYPKVLEYVGKMKSIIERHKGDDNAITNELLSLAKGNASTINDLQNLLYYLSPTEIRARETQSRLGSEGEARGINKEITSVAFSRPGSKDRPLAGIGRFGRDVNESQTITNPMLVDKNLTPESKEKVEYDKLAENREMRDAVEEQAYEDAIDLKKLVDTNKRRNKVPGMEHPERLMDFGKDIFSKVAKGKYWNKTHRNVANYLSHLAPPPYKREVYKRFDSDVYKYGNAYIREAPLMFNTIVRDSKGWFNGDSFRALMGYSPITKDPKQILSLDKNKEIHPDGRKFLESIAEHENIMSQGLRDEPMTWNEFADYFKFNERQRDMLNRYKKSVKDYLKERKRMEEKFIIDFSEDIASNLTKRDLKDIFLGDITDNQLNYRNILSEYGKLKYKLKRARKDESINKLEAKIAKLEPAYKEATTFESLLNTDVEIRQRLAQHLVNEKYKGWDRHIYYNSVRPVSPDTWSIEGKLADGREFNSYAYSQQDAESMVKGLRSKGADVSTYRIGDVLNRGAEYYRTKLNPQQLLELANQGHIPLTNPILKKLTDAMLSSVQRHSLRKRYVPGMHHTPEEFERQFERLGREFIYGSHRMYALTAMSRNLTEWARELDNRLKTEGRSKELNVARKEYDYAIGYFNQLKLPDRSFIDPIRGVMMATHVGGIKASFLVQQALQGFQTTIHLANADLQKHLGLSFTDATSIFTEASSNAMKAMVALNSVKKGLSYSEVGIDENIMKQLDSLDKMKKLGAVGMDELFGLTGESDFFYDKGLYKGLMTYNKVMSYAGRGIEKWTRIQSALTFYEIGKRRGLEGDELTNYIADGIDKSMSHWGVGGKSPILESKQLNKEQEDSIWRAIKKSFMTYKTFSFSNYGLYESMIRNKQIAPLMVKAGVGLGMHGITKFPLFATIFGIASLFTDDDIDYKMWEVADDLDQKLPVPIGTLLHRGVGGYVGLDTRQMFDESSPYVTDLMYNSWSKTIDAKLLEVGLGPAFAYSEDVTKGVVAATQRLIAEDGTLTKKQKDRLYGQFRKLVPVFARHIIESPEFQRDGIKYGNKQIYKPDDLTTRDVVFKMLSFPLEKSSRAYAEVSGGIESQIRQYGQRAKAMNEWLKDNPRGSISDEERSRAIKIRNESKALAKQLKREKKITDKY